MSNFSAGVQNVFEYPQKACGRYNAVAVPLRRPSAEHIKKSGQTDEEGR
jgi:hypothetical protein